MMMAMILSLLVLSLSLGRCAGFQGFGMMISRMSSSHSHAVALRSTTTAATVREALQERTEHDLRAFRSLEEGSVARSILFDRALRRRDLDIAVLRRTVDSLTTDNKTLEETQREAREEEEQSTVLALLRGAYVPAESEINAAWQRLYERKGEAESLVETTQRVLLNIFHELRLAFPAETQTVVSFEEVIRLLCEKKEQIQGMESGASMVACKTMFAKIKSIERFEAIYQVLKEMPEELIAPRGNRSSVLEEMFGL